METRTAQAISLFNAKRFREAFGIFKSFRVGFSADEKRAIEIAYECMTGKAEFYSMLSINAEDMVRKAIVIIKTKYTL